MADTWRVGVLFSRSGLSEITESEHFFGTALAIEEINAAGGVGGRMIEPIVYDPGSNNDRFRSQARQLLAEDGVNVIFGCSMSASRKAVLPLIERHNGLLLYPSMYEGFEYSENVLYTGATLNQNTFALADFILHKHGKRVVFIGADYIFPRESNRVMRDIIESKGGEVTAEHYVPLNADDDALRTVLDDIQRLRPDAVFSTVIGKTAQRFYRMYADSGLDPHRMPIASLTMAESEIAAIGAEYCAGHIMAATYFESLPGERNARFVKAFKSRFGERMHTSIWSEPAYMQVHLFARALERTGSVDTQKLSAAILGLSYDAPEGPVSVDESTRHMWLTPRIGVMRANGLFEIEWEANGPQRPDPYLTASSFQESWLR